MASLLRLQALAPALNVPHRRCFLTHLRLASGATAQLGRRLSTAASTNSPEPPAPEANLESGLYLVATPIGNLEDITLRALRVLKCANVILSEDTRHSGKLLQHYNIKTPLLSFHKFNEREREPSILRRLHEGEAVALISDAGTPGISDPGMELNDVDSIFPLTKARDGVHTTMTFQKPSSHPQQKSVHELSDPVQVL